MSFSQDVKKELCKSPPQDKRCAASELYGAMLYCHTFSHRELRVVTENQRFAKRLVSILKSVFAMEFDELRDPKTASGKIILAITSPEKIAVILEEFGFSPGDMISHHVNFGVLEEHCCRVSFLRGAFLAGGSVTDPERGYHLELATPHRAVARETSALLQEAGFAPKMTSRASGSVIYFKQSTAIEEFLTTVGAPMRAVELMSVKIEKDLRSGVNRRVNCDIANVTKTADASERHIDAIRRIESRLPELPEKLRETAQLRLRYPELSLTELAALCVPPVTKSCMNHRMRKLIAMAEAATAEAAS